MPWRKAESVHGCTGNLGVYVFILSGARTGKGIPRPLEAPLGEGAALTRAGVKKTSWTMFLVWLTMAP